MFVVTPYLLMSHDCCKLYDLLLWLLICRVHYWDLLQRVCLTLFQLLVVPLQCNITFGHVLLVEAHQLHSDILDVIPRILIINWFHTDFVTRPATDCVGMNTELLFRSPKKSLQIKYSIICWLQLLQLSHYSEMQVLATYSLSQLIMVYQMIYLRE